MACAWKFADATIWATANPRRRDSSASRRRISSAYRRASDKSPRAPCLRPGARRKGDWRPARQRPRERRFAHLFPEPWIESRQALEAEAARVARGNGERHHRRLDRERAAAAHRVEQRLTAVPASEPHDARGEVLLERRLARVLPIAALVERLARSVQIEGDTRAVEKTVDAHLGRARVHVGPAPAVGAKAVAHRVLDAQGGEFEALQRRAARVDVDANALSLAEPVGPAQRERRFVDVLFAAAGSAGKPHQHAGCEPRLEVGAQAGPHVAFERDPARNRSDLLRAELLQLVGEERFEASGAGSEESLRGHRGLSMMQAGETSTRW